MAEPTRKTPSHEIVLSGTDANVWSEYEIEAQTSLVDRPLRNLKYGDAFAVLDSFGDVGVIKDTAEGLFYRDTRYLSNYELRIEGKRPLLLGSTMHADKTALSVELTNPDLTLGLDKFPKDTLFLTRTKFLWKAVCYESVAIRSYDRIHRRFRLDMLFDADFRDLFEVRGMRRRQHGRRHVNVEAADRVAFHYQGLDGIARRTVLRFEPAPAHIDTNRATFEIDLAPGARSMVCISAACEEEAEPAVAGNFFRGYRALRRARRTQTQDVATVDSSNEPFADALGSAKSDVYTLVTDTPYGLYPYAGIPWFSTIFGRDGIITAMLMLWADPRIAQGVLRTLAAMQATDFDPASDAQPGKILHEMRQGEMANLREVPFGRYYGSVDSTPLFLMLAGQYFDRTGDRDTIAGIWPNIEAALDWIDRYGDRDGDGFVEYARETSSGLANQGWKDSHDAVFHADGATAVGPIALCEVQAYVYAAKLAIARLAGVFGFAEQALRLADQAERLRREFEAKFWCDDIGTYALALDGAKQPCRVRTSNAGHALFAGIAATDRAHKVVARLMDPEGFSGWGIRTLAHDQPRFNPMSYHNGSVWPHDNALIALGMARYGLKAEVARVLEGLCTAANHQDGQRLPELFCGFIRKPHCGPTPYPVACAPQAWAAASLLGLLAASLGLELGNDRDEIRFRDPVMPSQLNDLVIRCLRLGDSRVDVRLHRYGSDVTAHVLSRDGSARVLVLK